MENGCEVLAIYLSAGHSYFGRHQQGALVQKITSVGEVECLEGKGLVGDRFFAHEKNDRGQVTFFSSEVFAHLCEALKVVGADPSVLRRNVLTRGVDLNAWIGAEFCIQGVVFEGVEECRPCYWMDSALAPGAELAMRGQGG